MSKYQIIPYLVRVRVRNKTDELLTLGDLKTGSADTESLRALVASVCRSKLNQELTAKKDASHSMEIRSLHEGPDCAVIHVAAGEWGREGLLRKDGVAIKVSASDTTAFPLRHAFVLPSDHKQGLLLAERVGAVGSLTLLREMLAKAVNAYVDGAILDISPAMSGEAMKEWADEAEVKALILEQSHAKDHLPPLLHDLQGVPQIRIAAPRRKFWKLKQFGGLGAKQEDVVASIVPYLPNVKKPEKVERAAARLIDGGWTVSLELRGRNRRQRKVALQTQQGVTLTYPAGPEDALGRPSEEEFLAACREAVEDLSQFDDLTGLPDPSHCSWDMLPCHDGPKREVVWGHVRRDAAVADPGSVQRSDPEPN